MDAKTPLDQQDVAADMHARLAESGVTRMAADTSTEEDSAAIRERQRQLGVAFPGERIYERRTPAFDRYPLAKWSTIVNHGVPAFGLLTGFDARAIGGHNLTDSWLWIDELRQPIPPGSMFAINLPAGGYETMSFEWRSGPFGGAVVPVPGEYASVYAWDEWVPPLLVPLSAAAAEAVALASPLITPDADGVAAAPSLLAASANYLFNGTTFDRLRGVQRVTIFNSAVRNGTVNSADFTNYQWSGVIIAVNISAELAAQTLSAAIEGFDAVAAAYAPIADFGVIYTSATDAPGLRWLHLYPGVVDANLPATGFGISGALPRNWRLTMTPSAAGNWTYSAAANYVP